MVGLGIVLVFVAGIAAGMAISSSRVVDWFDGYSHKRRPSERLNITINNPTGSTGVPPFDNGPFEVATPVNEVPPRPSSIHRENISTG